MTIYEFRTSLTAISGATSTTTLRVPGGLMQQFLVQATVATTVFRANLVDSNSRTRMSYGFSTGELNDVGSHFPMEGRYTINITNASPDNETFQIVLAVQEK